MAEAFVIVLQSAKARCPPICEGMKARVWAKNIMSKIMRNFVKREFKN
jgi:hypothetical protein